MIKVAQFILVTVILGAVISNAQADDDFVKTFDVTPVMLDADDNAGSALGINYAVSGTLYSKDLSKDDADSDDLDVDKPIEKGNLVYSLKGTVTNDKLNNPKNFIESRVDGTYFRSTSYQIDVGLFYEYESDQSYENTQNVYGLTATMSKYGFPRKNDYVALYMNYGQVDPNNDTEREAVLGSDLETYDRWEFEAVYSINIGDNDWETLEFNIRYFQEIDAPDSIIAADLDVFKLSTVRLGFKDNLYIAYSSGSLPFDKVSDQIVEIGFSYKLK